MNPRKAVLLSVLAVFLIIAVSSAALAQSQKPTDRNDDDATINDAATSLNILKVAVTDHFAQFGSFPVGDNKFELLLLKEKLLNQPPSLLSRKGNPRTETHVRVLKALSARAPVSATNAAYSFHGDLSNETTGAVVIETVVFKATSQDAKALSLHIDGPQLSSPLGEADLKGRVKFGPIPTNGFGDVHVYLTHWGGKR